MAVTWPLRQRLKSYGQAQFRTDASTYTHGKRATKTSTSQNRNDDRKTATA